MTAGHLRYPLREVMRLHEARDPPPAWPNSNAGALIEASYEIRP